MAHAYKTYNKVNYSIKRIYPHIKYDFMLHL